MENRNYCDKCNKQVSDNHWHCANCGELLTSSLSHAKLPSGFTCEKKEASTSENTVIWVRRSLGLPEYDEEWREKMPLNWK